MKSDIEMYRVGGAVFHGHVAPRWGQHVGDVFVVRPHPADTLPPWLWGKAIQEAGKVLARSRRTAALWVQVPPIAQTGNWWRRVLQQSLGAVPVPVAVSEETPQPEQFNYYPPLHTTSMPTSTVSMPLLSDAEKSVLGVLVRVPWGYTAEIASLSLLSPPWARRTLFALARRHYVYQRQDQTRGWPYWEAGRKGLSLILRYWCVPKGADFQVRAERRSGTAQRHRRTARLWNAWLRKAGHHVYGGWSEVNFPGVERHAPDALAWGLWNKREVLYWLEVESGHKARQKIAENTQHRFLTARGVAKHYRVRLVFVVLGMPWAVKAAATGIRNLDEYTAVLLGNWRDFGKLPGIRWGYVQGIEK